MDKRFDIKQALRAFDKVTRYGLQQGGEYRLDGLLASSGFDGYTVTLADNHVSLTIHFHNSYDVEYSDSKALDNFLRLIDRIDTTQYH